MKLSLGFSLICGFASSVIADSIQVTAQCKGTPVQEAARTTICASSIKPLADGSTDPVRATVRSGQLVTLEMIREFRYPTVLIFPKATGAVIEPEEFVTKNTGLTVAITATHEGDQIMFHGTCTIRRPASTTMAKSTTPKDQPSVASFAFITRECDFTGRTPIGTPAKIDLGEQGIDVGELILTFASAK